MFAMVWGGAILGVVYQVIFHEKYVFHTSLDLYQHLLFYFFYRYKLLEVIFYLIVGICPSIVVIDMVRFIVSVL